jgi:protein SCO1/2
MVNKQSTLVSWVVWGVLAGVTIGVSVLFVRTRFDQAIRLVDRMPVYSQVEPFFLTNQLGSVSTFADLQGKVWIADIVFSRCPGPCPRMTERMAALQRAFPVDAPIRFVTLTTDPTHDTPAVLKRFSERFGADPNRWFFLTGSMKEIAGLALKGLKLTALEKEPNQQTVPDDLFIHSTVFMLVDQKGRVRGSFESLEPDFEQQLITAANALIRTNPH